MTGQETVLCIRRNRLPMSWVREISVVPMRFPDFVTICTKAKFEFIPRSEAETDPRVKQIIPYVVLQTSDFSKTAAYNRQGSEKRLHDLWSIGIGGHINPEDESGQATSFETAVMNGMNRELDEELKQRVSGDPLSFLGIISEEETDVGSVHLGAVFRLTTHTPGKYLAGDELHRFYWESTKVLTDLNLELWSKLALKLLPA